MKSDFFKKIIIIILMIFAFLSIYFGAYLPFVKAEKYILFIQNLRNLKTLEQFQGGAGELLNFYSPIGQEEVVRFLSRDMVNMVRNPEQPEQISREIINSIEPKIYKKNVRHLLSIAEVYSILWGKYRKEDDFRKAESYLLEALKIGPNLPPVLYPLFDIYRAHGDQEKMKEISQRIVSLWPTEKRIAQ